MIPATPMRKFSLNNRYNTNINNQNNTNIHLDDTRLDVSMNDSTNTLTRNNLFSPYTPYHHSSNTIHNNNNKTLSVNNDDSGLLQFNKLLDSATPCKPVIRAHRRSSSVKLSSSLCTNHTIQQQFDCTNRLSIPTSPTDSYTLLNTDSVSAMYISSPINNNNNNSTSTPSTTATLTEQSPTITGPPKKQIKMHISTVNDNDDNNNSNNPTTFIDRINRSSNSSNDVTASHHAHWIAVASPHVLHSPQATPSVKKQQSRYTFPHGSPSASVQMHSAFSQFVSPVESPVNDNNIISNELYDHVLQQSPLNLLHSIQSSPITTTSTFELQLNDVTPISKPQSASQHILDELPVVNQFNYDSDCDELNNIKSPESTISFQLKSPVRIASSTSSVSTDTTELLSPVRQLVNLSNVPIDQNLSYKSPEPQCIRKLDINDIIAEESNNDDSDQDEYTQLPNYNRTHSTPHTSHTTSKGVQLATAYNRGRSGSLCIDGLNTVQPRSNIISQLTPDISAFNEQITLHKKTPGKSSIQRYQPPPTPERKQRRNKSTRGIERNSLHDSKLLCSFVIGDVIRDNYFDTGFYSHVAIGKGSFFDVFRCIDVHTKLSYAIKRSQHQYKSRRDRDHYLSEIHYMKLLGTHNNIVEYIRAWQESDYFYIQMEYCPMNLHEFVQSSRANNTIDLDFLVNIAQQISCALKHLHSKDLFHLDIKPENILVSASNNDTHQNDSGLGQTLKLGDFGQARLKSQLVDGVEGDCQYMAPELLNNINSVNGAADMFSLGLLLLEICSDIQLPKAGDVWQQLRSGSVLPYITRYENTIISTLIQSLLQPNPRDRPTADHVVTMFARWKVSEQKVQQRRASACCIIDNVVENIHTTNVPALQALHRRQHYISNKQ